MLHIITPHTEKQLLSRRFRHLYEMLSKSPLSFHRIAKRGGFGYFWNDPAEAEIKALFIASEIEELVILPGDEVVIFPFQGYNFSFTHTVVSVLHQKFKGLVKVSVLREYIPYFQRHGS